MRILVTGGCGFLGSNFIRYWLKTYPKDEIVNLDKLTYAGHLSSTKDYKNNSRYTFIKGDITDTAVVNQAMKGVMIVVHFAAESHVDRSIKDPQVFLKTNVIGTGVLLDAALRHKVKRFHHVSTDEVFGALALTSQKKFTETTHYDPGSPYAASKAASDHIVRSYHNTYNLPITITNCSNNFGPFQDPEKFIPRMITDLLEDRPIKIYGDGKYVRDWLYVEDHCRAIDLVIHEGRVGETYVVGGQTKETNNLQIAKLLVSIFQKSDSYIHFVKDRPGHDRRYAVDWRKINKELGWSPKHDFERWFLSTINWYKDNKWWWKPLKEKSESIYKNSSL